MRKYVVPYGLFLLLGALRASSAGAPDIALLEALASPEMEGRGVGTPGLDRARDYIVGRLRSSGLAPAFQGADGARSYLQDFRVFTGNELLEGNAFLGREAPDFIPLAFSRSGSAGAPMVFVGFGITLRSSGPSPGPAVYDDYAGLDVHGKIVVAMTGDPGTGNKDSVFRDPSLYSYSTPMYKVQNAELHGAAGIVLVRDPLSLTGRDPPLRFQPRQGGGATTGILAGQASVSFVDSLLGGAGSLRSLQEKIARAQRPASFPLEGAGSLRVALARQVGSVQNIVAVVPGRDPARSGEYLVIGAHYDHLGFGGDSSLDPDGSGKVHLGADDNASGVQAAVDIAERVRAMGGGARPLILALFSAEEVGLLGSQHFVENLPLPEGARVAAMLNLDMVGRLQENRLSALAVKSGKELDSLLETANRESGFELAKGDTGFGSSDHASFLRAKVPSLFLTTGAHGDYHRPSDSSGKINVAGLARVEALAFSFWKELDGMGHPPTYDPGSEVPDQPRDRGYGSYFGSIPDFEQGELQGVLLQGVRPDSPAALAGLRAGDLLTDLGEIKVRNLQDLVFALRYYRPNEEVLVQWNRAGRPMRASATLKDRAGPK